MPLLLLLRTSAPDAILQIGHRKAMKNPVKSIHPNQPGYDELVTIYSHQDGATTIGAVAQTPNELVKGDFSSSTPESTYVRNFGDGKQVVTNVIWVKQ